MLCTVAEEALREGFLALEHSLHRNDTFLEVNTGVPEYITLGHAEVVPIEDTDKDPSAVLFYLRVYACCL